MTRHSTVEIPAVGMQLPESVAGGTVRRERLETRSQGFQQGALSDGQRDVRHTYSVKPDVHTSHLPRAVNSDVHTSHLPSEA